MGNNIILRRAQFHNSYYDSSIIISLNEREKNLKAHLISNEGTYWIESNKGFKSSFFETRKDADLEFEKYCLKTYVNEEIINLGDIDNNCPSWKLPELFPYFAEVGGGFNYFVPETKDFLFISIISELHCFKNFSYKVNTISKAINQEIRFSEIPDEDTFNGLLWEITKNSAILNKVIIHQNIKALLGWEIIKKERIYNHSHNFDLLRSMLLLSPYFEPRSSSSDSHI